VRLEGVAVVLLGSFNPQIFQPMWMAKQGLLDDDEAEAAEVQIIHPEVASFSVDRLKIDVARDRFQIETQDETYVERLRDTVIGAFGRLAHTPVSAFGINRHTHFEMSSMAKWHALGNHLVPKGSWEPILNKPGTRSLTVEGVRPDDFKGFIRVQFEPSVKVPTNGVYVAVNDHFQLDTEGSPMPASNAIEVLETVWADAVARARVIVQHVVGLV
jgi:hypothetical protein